MAGDLFSSGQTSYGAPVERRDGAGRGLVAAFVPSAAHDETLHRG
ncbi:hypothetical protein BURPS1106B_2302 [Burkholderia pseudomallei 1106b]|uniref:Uncharacterized protein n=1 Tax=Burkholderia pseudomallei (strain 1106a) TaxID=357348 RepID=A3P993_BURP0|nr:hypothetical protein BURPS1106A_A2874 [Burkholderia pseudomallei 1106a]AFR20755.1 hypothetical protein BPC006_II2832 [Burkholderia pseudomallei BPC006]EDS83867.1 hypothetical protein BURPSS13_X1004 [Burkholderia pseudomallei S13]EES21706.1 hypothetical protein BURPS1106B_2302 [Burkholderia pseudomallei 1106b]